MKNSRLRFLLTFLILLSLIWLAWPDQEASDYLSSDAVSNDKPRGLHIPGFGDLGRETKQDSLLKRSKPSNEAGLQRIENLIENRTMNHHEVAEQLRAIMEDKRMPEEVRKEALGHGIILDLPVFADLAADTQMSEEMAEDLLQTVINENSNPALQIRALKDFLNHQSSEIREEAQQVLAFILGDDLGEADEATLIQMADAKLKQIEAEKPPEE